MTELKITLCCSGGVSTKMLVKKIVEAAEKMALLSRAMLMQSI